MLSLSLSLSLWNMLLAPQVISCPISLTKVDILLLIFDPPRWLWIVELVSFAVLPAFFPILL